MRSLCAGCCGHRVSFTGHQQSASSPTRVAASKGAQSCGHVNNTGTSRCNDLTKAIDTLKTVMGSIILNLDDAAAIRMKVDQLLSSGVLRPLTDMVVDHLQHVMSNYGPIRPTGEPGTSVSGPTFSQEKYVFGIVERSMYPFLGQLMARVLSQLAEGFQEGTPISEMSCSQVVNLLASTVAKEVVNSFFGRPRGRPVSPTIGRPKSQESVENCKVKVSKESGCTTTPTSEGRDYFFLVSRVLMQLIRKIEPATKLMPDFTAYCSRLTEKIVSEFCSASGLSGNEAYQAVSIKRMRKDIYKELLKVFRTKAMIHALLLYRKPVFSTVLTRSFVKELLQLCQKVSGVERQRRFSFLHRRFDGLKKLFRRVQ